MPNYSLKRTAATDCGILTFHAAVAAQALGLEYSTRKHV